MKHPTASHRTMHILLALCFTSVSFGLMLFFPPPPLAHAATITVQSSADGPTNSTNCPGSGCRLRDAIAASNPAGGDTIDFSLTYPATITLTSGELVITKSLTINGPDASNLTISGNNAVRVMLVSGVALNLSKVTIANGNAGDFSAGGGIGNLGTLTVNNSTFYNNTAMGSGQYFGFGGGIANGAVYTLTITNTTFFGNSADKGGGIANNGTLTITNSTIAGNSANTGGGVHNEVTATLTDTIVANNTAGTGGNCGGAGTFIDGGKNLQWHPNSGCGFGLAAGDPKLAPLGNYGGPTKTMALFVGSAVIDTGNDPACPSTDQRGVTRWQGAHCDIGAFEGTGYPLYLPIILK